MVIKKFRINSLIDIIFIYETKLDGSFSDSQFKMKGYQFPPFQRDSNNRGGYVDRSKSLETKIYGNIFLESKISSKKR